MTTLSKNRIYCERKKVHVRIELGGKCYFLLFVFWLYVFTNVKGEVGAELLPEIDKALDF